MRRVFGFTLIELMITVAIIAVLAAVALPSYQQYVKRGIRAQGQQFLMDIAQRQEQYFLDQRNYATGLGNGAGKLNIPVPQPVADNYGAAAITVNNAATPPTWKITLTPSSSMMAGDGILIINNLQQHWRGLADGNAPGGSDCVWEDTKCKPS